MSKLARLAAKLQAKRKREDPAAAAAEEEESNPRKRVLNRAVDAVADMLAEDVSMSRKQQPSLEASQQPSHEASQQPSCGVHVRQGVEEVVEEVGGHEMRQSQNAALPHPAAATTLIAAISEAAAAVSAVTALTGSHRGEPETK